MVALPARPTADRWMQNLGVPSMLSEQGTTDTELYEEEDRFILNIEMPGFEPEDIEVTWNDGRLNVAAEHFDEEMEKKRTYHRKFRLPKDVEDEEIEARYSNGILKIEIPISEDSGLRGRSIEVKS